jgi:hypothetical protein
VTTLVTHLAVSMAIASVLARQVRRAFGWTVLDG